MDIELDQVIPIPAELAERWDHGPPVGEDHEAFVATLSERFVGIQCSCGANWSKRRDSYADTSAVLHLQETTGVSKSEGLPQHLRLRLVHPSELPRVAGE